MICQSLSKLDVCYISHGDNNGMDVSNLRKTKLIKWKSKFLVFFFICNVSKIWNTKRNRDLNLINQTIIGNRCVWGLKFDLLFLGFFVFFWVFFVVFEGTLDGFWNCGTLRKDVTAGLETVFVGYVRNIDFLSFGRLERKTALDSFSCFLPELFQFTRLFGMGTILRFVAEKNLILKNYGKIKKRLNRKNILPVVIFAAFFVHAFGGQNSGFFCWCSASDCHQSN